MVSPTEIDSPFWQSRTNIAVRQRKSLEDREILETICAPVESLALKARSSLSLKGDDTGTFIVPALDARAQVLSIKERSNSVGNQVFKLASYGKRTVVCSDCS